MLLPMIIILSGCSSLSSSTSLSTHESDLYGELISPQLSLDPLIIHDIERPNGPAKKMVVYHLCQTGACLQPEIRYEIKFDHWSRPLQIEFEPDFMPATAFFLYENEQDVFPSIQSSQFGSYIRKEHYERDQHGNILTTNGIPWDISKTNGGFRRINDKSELELGIEYEYYEKGQLIRVHSLPGKNTFNQGEDKTLSTTEYRYEFYDDGVPSSKRTITSVDGAIRHGAVDKFLPNGWLDKHWSSLWGQPEVAHYAYRYTNYKVDRYDNWLSRDLCLVSLNWDTFHFCHEERREITYWSDA